MKRLPEIILKQAVLAVFSVCFQFHPAAIAQGAGGIDSSGMSVTSPDGTISVNLPTGWRPVLFQQGVMIVKGANQAQVTQEQAFTYMDPHGANSRMHLAPIMPFTADSAKAFQIAMNTRARAGSLGSCSVTVDKVKPMQLPGIAGIVSCATVSGTMTSTRGLENFEAVVAVGIINKQGGGWTVNIDMIEAPVAIFAEAKPEMIAIYNSYHVNQGIRQNQVRNNVANNEAQGAAGRAMLARTRAQNAATFNASMNNAANVQDSIDKSTAGFVRHLRGTSTVQNNATGQHFEVDSNAAAGLTNNFSNLQEVPTSQLKKGVDY